MSDYLPFEIQVDIIKRLPVKSLIQFRSVSKAWKSLIDSSQFIAHYSGHVRHLLVRYIDRVDFNEKYVSVVDDDTFPRNKVSVSIPLLVENCRIIGRSQGLLCLHDGYRNSCGVPLAGIGRVVLWNPSIRKAVVVVLPNVPKDRIYTTALGFGVCHETNDPKIVKITHIRLSKDTEQISCIPQQVEVFTLSAGVWRIPYNNNNLPRKSIRFGWNQVVVDGFLYWLAEDWIITTDSEIRSYSLIVSFDMENEEFREVNLPEHTYGELLNNPIFIVWMMEDGLFTKLFTINTPQDASVIGFRKSGAPIVEIVEDVCGLVVVYEPYSNYIDNFWIHGTAFSFAVYPYMETLLLLDQPDLMVYNDTFQSGELRIEVF
ncbi:hypothetical protein L1987_65271 [Smallanthus sonchifolius]|uniref:Uncharacterized protein n=1 Tax=Smallanthus sonchifolius TaxID=185202 RepID=A0ACB9BU76_9ASTR|nr:hypothetical protein L1987_65271 [Smallanthus sonchifolius]